MNTIIWKELRENAKWAALGMLAIAAGMTYILHNEVAGRYGNDYGVMATGFQMITVFGGALVGLVLGGFQVAPECRPDHWAFLIHRPLSATRIFLGKALAGLILLVLAIDLPLLGALLWASTPGHIPGPFDWRMALPGLADTIAAAGYYFAAMLLARRQARWLGSRILVLGIPVVGSFVTAVVPEFWQAALAGGSTALLTATAAWGAFTRSGHYTPQPAFPRFALGTTVCAGLFLLGTACVGMVASLVPSPAYEWTMYRAEPDGTIVRVTTSATGATVSIADLNGNVISTSRSDPFACDRAAVVWAQGDPRSPNRAAYVGAYANYRQSGRFFCPVTSYRSRTTLCYYLLGERKLVAYEMASRRLLASFGAGADGKPFGGNLLSTSGTGQLLTFDNAVYRLLRLEDRRTELLFGAPADETILGSSSIELDKANQSDDRQTYAIATDKALYILDPTGQRLRYAFPTAGSHGMLRIYPLENPHRYLILLNGSPAREGEPSSAVELSADGAILRELGLPPLPVPVSHDPLWQAAPMFFAPPLVAGTVVAIGAIIDKDELFKDARSALPLIRLGLGLLFAGALLAAALTAWLARRYAFGRRRAIGWVVGNFLLGLLGLVTMLAVLEWPALAPCPACGRRRRVDRECCEHCAAPFPRPAADGTEIFGPMAEPALAAAEE